MKLFKWIIVRIHVHWMTCSFHTFIHSLKNINAHIKHQNHQNTWNSMRFKWWCDATRQEVCVVYSSAQNSQNLIQFYYNLSAQLSLYIQWYTLEIYTYKHIFGIVHFEWLLLNEYTSNLHRKPNEPNSVFTHKRAFSCRVCHKICTLSTIFRPNFIHTRKHIFTFIFFISMLTILWSHHKCVTFGSNSLEPFSIEYFAM